MRFELIVPRSSVAGVEMASYFLLSVMEEVAHPWETLARQI